MYEEHEKAIAKMILDTTLQSWVPSNEAITLKNWIQQIFEKIEAITHGVMRLSLKGTEFNRFLKKLRLSLMG